MTPAQIHLLQLVGLLIGLGVLMRQAAGRLAPKVAVGTLFFLVSRWPVVVAGTAGAAGWAWILLTTHAPGRAPMPVAAVIPFAAFLGLGVAVLVVGPIFFTVRAFAAKPELALERGEEILSSQPANHFLRGEARGGRAVVTTRRLAFCPHRFNVQLSCWSVPFARIEGMHAEGSRFLVVDVEGEQPAWLVAQGPVALAESLAALAAAPEGERASVATREA